MMRAGYSVLLFVCVLSFPLAANSATTAQINTARINGLAWLMSAQAGDGYWNNVPQIKVQATSAALQALANAGIKNGYSYSAAITALSNADALSIDSLSNQIIALNSAGSNVSSLVARLVNGRNEQSLSWGAYAKYEASFPDTPLALDAILLSNTSYVDTGYTLGFVAGRQNPDGGWPYNANAPVTSQSRVIPTAYNLLSFARHRAVGWGVDSQITSAVNWLTAQSKADGGFSEDSSATTGNAFETALVFLAIAEAQSVGNAAAVAAQPTLDTAQDFLISSQLADGSWANDAFQTAVVLQSLPATTLTDTDQDGIPDNVELVLGTDPATPDSRLLAKGNGAAVDGETKATLLSSISTGDSFSLFLTPPAGTGPYSWEIVSGALPDGLSLNASTGEISGVASSAGTYNFITQVTDGSSGAVTTQASQIISAAGVVVPALPQWGFMVMALLLMTAAWRVQMQHRKQNKK